MHKLSEDESGIRSKVSERLDWLRGRKVVVRVRYAEIGQLGEETFSGVYEDTLLLGREYFFLFSIGSVSGSSLPRMLSSWRRRTNGRWNAPPFSSSFSSSRSSSRSRAL